MSASPMSPKKARVTTGQPADQALARAKAGQASQPEPEPGGIWRRGTAPARAMGWLPFTTLVLAVLGLIDSAYQVYTHFSATGLLGCSAKTDACALVQNSSYAYIFGIPVAVFGLVFYAFMVVACSPQAWRATWPAVHRVRLASVVIGILFVLYLVYTEVVTLGQICAYCTSVHIITFLLFVLIVVRFTAPSQPAAAAAGHRPARQQGDGTRPGTRPGNGGRPANGSRPGGRQGGSGATARRKQ